MNNFKDTCPYCDSWDLVYTDNGVEGPNGPEVEVYCRNCYEEWIEIQ